jgi:hypothetical protein
MYFHHGGRPGVVAHVNAQPQIASSLVSSFQYLVPTVKCEAMNMDIDTMVAMSPILRTHQRLLTCVRLMSFKRATAVTMMNMAAKQYKKSYKVIAVLHCSE